MRRGLPALSAGLLLATAACSDDPTGSEPLDCDPDQDVSVSVEGDLLPRFSWEPACGMASVQVWGPPREGWVLLSGGDAPENPIAPAVVYGITPEGLVAPAPATPLHSGVEYTVTVYRWIGDPGGPGSLFEAGSATFQAP